MEEKKLPKNVKEIGKMKDEELKEDLRNCKNNKSRKILERELKRREFFVVWNQKK